MPSAKPPSTAPAGEIFEGGWRAEGKERPVSPKTCETCQNPKKALNSLEEVIMCDTCINEFHETGEVKGVGTGKVNEGRVLDDTVINKAMFG